MVFRENEYIQLLILREIGGVAAVKELNQELGEDPNLLCAQEMFRSMKMRNPLLTASPQERSAL